MDNALELTISINIRQSGYGGNSLSLNNTIVLPAKDFLDMCRILGEFQTLADKFKQK